MRITVQYLAQIRRAVGCAEEILDVPDGSLADLVRHLAVKHPDAARLFLGPTGEPSRSLLFFVNDAPFDAAAKLPANAIVTILTPMAGGSSVPLSEEERATYEWQMWVPHFGEEGQRKLKAATVLVSRIGGVGGALAQQLAAAGVGKLILAHAGNVRASDLNRQTLMSHAGLGQPRLGQAARRLRELNPRLEIEEIPENISPDNARQLVAQADVVASCAPLFSERLALNAAAVALGKPLVDCAMYDFDVQILTVIPGGPCLQCLYPEPPAAWKREFPVFGAVAATAGCLGAVEVIKTLSGIGERLDRQMLLADLGSMIFRKLPRSRDPQCRVCSTSPMSD